MNNIVKEYIDYELVINEDKSVYIKLLKGKYKNIIFQYGDVNIQVNENEELVVSFVYEIKESPIKESKIKHNEFRNYIGDILLNIMSNHYNSEANELVNEYKGEKVEDIEYEEV